ncbi:MAG: nitroreductase family protein [Lentisphaeria bacterium]
MTSLNQNKPDPETAIFPVDSFLNLSRRRYSCRNYDPDRCVPEGAIQNCLEAARLAPSACNKQPWRFVVVDDPETLAAIRKKGQMPGIDHAWWESVPVMVALAVEKNVLTHKIAPAFSKIPYYLLDAGIAGEHFILAAAAQGLGTCWIGWFRPKIVKEILDIPRHVDIVALLTLGYPAPGKVRTKQRRDIDEIAFRNKWNNKGMPPC